jgi:hypothetical protein
MHKRLNSHVQLRLRPLADWRLHIDNATDGLAEAEQTMNQRRRNNSLLAALLVAGLFAPHGTGVFAAERGEKPRRARPPKWSADVLDVFFEDAREKLEGERPDYAAKSAIATSQSPASSQVGAAQDPSAFAWSKLIDAETLETEIKRLAQAVAQDVTSPTEFKGGAYQNCRRHFSMLATLFAIAAEYDGEVRWQDAAPGLRDVFARAGYNCKVGTDQTYQEAVQRKQDLADLVSGSRPRAAEAERAADWSQVTDRPPIMQRLNIAHEERLTKWLANEREFGRHSDEVRHEAQLIAAVADVIGREGFDYWDDKQYAEYARSLRQAATDIAAAVELDNFQSAREAGNRMTKACADCHDGYRE